MGKVWELENEPRRIDVAAEASAYLDAVEAEPDFLVRRIRINRALHVGISYANISPTQFYRVFDNLMKNAFDATPPGGTIVVVLHYREDCPFLIVGDDGDGIPAEDIPKIFSPDFTTKTSRGTGLGLAIVREICSEVGATIQVENNPNRGAIFSIHFQGGFEKHTRSEPFKQEVNA